MPVFMTDNQFAPWLSGDAGVEYLKPVPNDDLQRWPVSKRVNSSNANADDPSLFDKICCRISDLLAPPGARLPDAKFRRHRSTRRSAQAHD
jgi:hypothetical protein